MKQKFFSGICVMKILGSGIVLFENSFDDYRKYIHDKYDADNSGEFLLPTQRAFHSSR
jgi:hypothetical protein